MYTPITLQSRRKGGEWRTVNAFGAENAAVMAHTMRRPELLAEARRQQMRWSTNNFRPDVEYRVTGTNHGDRQ